MFHFVVLLRYFAFESEMLCKQMVQTFGASRSRKESLSLLYYQLPATTKNQGNWTFYL